MIWALLGVFVAILVWDLIIFRAYFRENDGVPDQNRCKNSQERQNKDWTFFAHSIFVLFGGIFRVLKNFVFFDMKKIPQKFQWFADFSGNHECQIIKSTEISDFLPTSRCCNSAPSRSWVTSDHTGTMYSSRYVDSRALKCSTGILGPPNRVTKLVKFGNFTESRSAPPYQKLDKVLRISNISHNLQQTSRSGVRKLEICKK